MKISIKHKFACLIPDEPDETQIRPSNWNDEHEISGMVLSVNGTEPDNAGNVALSFNTDLALIYQISKL